MCLSLVSTRCKQPLFISRSSGCFYLDVTPYKKKTAKNACCRSSNGERAGLFYSWYSWAAFMKVSWSKKYEVISESQIPMLKQCNLNRHNFFFFFCNVPLDTEFFYWPCRENGQNLGVIFKAHRIYYYYYRLYLGSLFQQFFFEHPSNSPLTKRYFFLQ